MSGLEPTANSIRRRQVDQVQEALGPAASSSAVDNLFRALVQIQSTPARQIQSPPTQRGRASVAVCIRLVPADDDASWDKEEVLPTTLEEFISQDWVRRPGVKAEILYIRRAKRVGDRWSSQLAFPGGRKNVDDESAQYTALRETWEEVGIDLAERGWLSVGQLDDREITTSLGKRLLMILSSFVFLQTSRKSPEPELDASEVSTVHWIPLELLFPPPSWSTISVSLAPRMAPRNHLLRQFIHLFVGSMQFPAISLPDDPAASAEGWLGPSVGVPPEVEAGGDASWWPRLPWEKPSEPGLRLWGISLSITLDLVSLISHPRSTPPETTMTLGTKGMDAPQASPNSSGTAAAVFSVPSSFVLGDGGRAQSFPGGYPAEAAAKRAAKRKRERGAEKKPGRGLNAGTTSVLPRFSLPDVDFFVWCFGRRYRSIVRAWDESVDLKNAGAQADRRVNWSGAALSAFYTAVRKALVVAVVLRILWTTGSLVALVWWLWRRTTAARGF